MPNHIQNRISFECSEAEFEKVKKLMNTAKEGPENFDFNALIPMPESLNIEAGSRGENALNYYRYFLEDCADSLGMSDSEKEALAESYKETYGIDDDSWRLGEQYYENIDKYGSANWYDWCIRKWGTKWNAYEVEWGYDYVCFQTAWSGVPELVAKLSKKFPDIAMDYYYADEDIGRNCGQIAFQDGKVIDMDIPDMDSKEAYELAFQVWATEAADWGFKYDEKSGTYIYMEEV